MIHAMIGRVRTTVELTPDIHARIKAYAEEHGQSMGCVLGDFAAYGINKLAPQTPSIKTDPRTGIPYLDVDLGHTFTSAEVTAMIAED